MEDFLLQYGLAGAIIIILLGIGKVITNKLWKKLEEKDEAHAEDRKEWFKKLDELLDKQNKAMKEVGEGHNEALKDLAQKFDKRQGEINDTFLTAFKQAFNKI